MKKFLDFKAGFPMGIMNILYGKGGLSKTLMTQQFYEKMMKDAHKNCDGSCILAKKEKEP